MDLEDARLGTRVRVQLDHRKPHRQEALGTIKKHYGNPEYMAFEVRNTDFSEIKLPASEMLRKPLRLGPIAPARTYRIRPPLTST